MSIDFIWQTRNDSNNPAVLFQVWVNVKMKLCEYVEEVGINRGMFLKAIIFLMGTVCKYTRVHDLLLFENTWGIYHSFNLAGMINIRF